VRYCDFLLGFAGPQREAVEIKSKVGEFLRDELKLELSEPTTLITHATSQVARFLGYEIRTQRADTKITWNRRAVNGAIGLFVPRDVIRRRCVCYMSKGKPAQRGPLLHDEDYTIVAKYGSEYRGFGQYYLLAQDVPAWGSCVGSWRHRCSRPWPGNISPTVAKMARKYKASVETANGSRTCFQVAVHRPAPE
jgi:hypothetical protein